MNKTFEPETKQQINISMDYGLHLPVVSISGDRYSVTPGICDIAGQAGSFNYEKSIHRDQEAHNPDPWTNRPKLVMLRLSATSKIQKFQPGIL